MRIASATTVGNSDDHEYHGFLVRLGARFAKVCTADKALFTTDAEGLWEAYLQSFPESDRQHHNCSACRHFIQRFGGLVTILDDGSTAPAIWPDADAMQIYNPALSAMARIVNKAKVTGVFLSSDRALGQPETGPWQHLSVSLPHSMVYQRCIFTAGQAMAEKKQDFINVSRALEEFTQPILEQALTLLRTDSLYRSEKVIGPAQWLHDLHLAVASTKRRANSIWKAIASAPAGFCHPRSSMAGTLLEDIAAGMDFVEVSRRFAAKMHPLQYQRPQAAPSAGAIAQAEKIVAELGAAGSLARRIARLDEVQSIWQPKPAADHVPGAGVFGHLAAKGVQRVPQIQVPPVTMTWEKFARTVLPEADAIEFHARAARDNYCALVTAVNADAPPILQWDSLERRNPVSWYVWHGGAPPSQYGLRTGAFCPVSAITLKPSQWGQNPGAFSHQGEAVAFLLEGARETRVAGAAIFPEILKSEFHGIRSVIEAYSRSAEMQGLAEGSACGIILAKGDRWAHVFRVTSKGCAVDYLLDRWD